MTLPRARLVDKKFLDALGRLSADGGREAEPDGPVREGSLLTRREALDLFHSQVVSRHLDIAARKLKAEGRGYYTIGSSGHEGNVVLGKLLRTTDPCLLHYRSGAFMCQRAKQGGSTSFIRDVCLSLTASTEDPVSGGRHKAWGSAALWVPPQTSTIASHLPRAAGMAFGLERMKRLKLELPVPGDSIVCATFGDASANHSVLLGGVNSALWAAFQKAPTPLLLVCEDNGIGISVRTPPGWTEANWRGRAGLEYFAADGLDLFDAFENARKAVEFCRAERRPAFLHLKVVRMLGHAGTDMETEYLTGEQIEANEALDPLVRSARLLVGCGASTPEKLQALYEEVREEVGREAERATTRPKLRTAAEVVAPLAPHSTGKVRAEAERADYGPARLKLFGGDAGLPEKHPKPRHLAMMIAWTLGDLLAKYPEMLVFGEDVAKKGGVYYCTQGLHKLAGPERVFDTLLDETSIIGLALGASQLGLLPCPEIQYLAYFHNAEDQLRGEACSQSFFSNGRFRNPMVARIASFAYQRGFGGHFHNDNSIAALRDIPGLVVAAPSRGDDAVGMLRTLFALAKTDGRVCVFLEPIARYMTKDLHAEGDGLWQFKFPAPGSSVPFGEPRVYAEGPRQDLTVLTYGNGAYLSLRAAKTLEEAYGLRCRVVDLRWLQPLNVEAIVEHAKAAGKVLIVDECRRTGSVSEAIVTALVEALGPKAPAMARLTGLDTYIPLADAANLVLPQEEDIVREARRLAGA